MKICEILRTERIIPEFTVNSKDEIITTLIELFKDDERVDDIEKVKVAVLEREKIMSTGVGKGFAIPHAKTEGVNNIIAGFARTNSPIDFDSLDKEPVNLIFLLVGKENMVSSHIKLLSRISRMMNNDEFREALLKAETAKEIFSCFQEEEEKYFNI